MSQPRGVRYNHSCRNSRTARNDSDELGLDPVVIHVSQPLLESLSLAQTVGLADWVSPPNPHSCRYCGTNPVAGTLLASLTWFKPGERLSLANRWMCQYPWCKNTGAGRGSNPGGN